MSAKLSPQETINTLQDRKSNLRCNDVKKLLEGLGFEVRDGNKGGHKLFFHSGLPDFVSGSFNCEHGKNPTIKSAYVGNIIKIIKQHENDLITFLGDKK